MGKINTSLVKTENYDSSFIETVFNYLNNIGRFQIIW